jgi:hypothetical protein
VTKDFQAQAQLYEAAEGLVREALTQLQEGHALTEPEARRVLRWAIVGTVGGAVVRPCLECRAMTRQCRSADGWECQKCLTWTSG